MKIYNKITFLLLFLQLTAVAMQQVVVQTMSDSGKTVKLDIGALQGVKGDDLADFTLKSGTLDVPRYSLIGSGRVLKVFQNYSYWYFPQGESQSLKTGKTYHLMLRRETLSGRVGVSIDYKLSAYDNNKTKKRMIEGERSSFPTDLIQQKKSFVTKVYDEQKISDSDYKKIKEVNLNRSKSVLLDEEYMELQYIRADTNIVNRKKITKEYKEKLAKNQHINQVRKINKLKHGYDELYYEVNTLDDRTDTVFYEKRQKKIKDAKIPAETLAMINKEGGLWSTDMSDAELKNYLLKTGVARAQTRQQNVLSLESGNEVILYLGSNLTGNYLQEDSNHQNNGYMMGIGYDFHLVRVSKDLMNWSFDFKFERGTTSIGQETLNSRIVYGAISGHVNYYFLNHPHSRNRFAWYVGAGAKRGNGEGNNINLSAPYEYEISALPSMQLGMKYRMPAGRDYEYSSGFGFGFNAKLTYEALTYKTINTVQDDFQPNQSVGNARFDIGLSIYF